MKRKAPDDEPAVASHRAVAWSVLDSADSTVKDRYYAGLYAKDVDFGMLGRQDAEFAAVLKADRQLDFTNPATLVQLTKTLLKLHFGLKIELPDDRLCPPVPNRHNYILWLKELLDTTSYAEPGRRLTGIDIGTGASCIYPLLGATQRPWYFVATDIDMKSLDYARRNVAINGLEDRVRVVTRNADDALLLPLDECGIDRLDFVMTNPPFYESAADLARSAASKSRPPNSVCTGAPVEMVVDGGEVAFVARLLQESLILRDRAQWYTAMFGKLPSLQEFIKKLRENGIDNYAVTEFSQGKKTKRWAVGWSFCAMRPSDKAARNLKAATWKSLLPHPTWAEVCTFTADGPVSPLVRRINEVMAALDLLSWAWESEKLQGTGRAGENVWARAWRRKQKRQQQILGDTATLNATRTATGPVQQKSKDREETCKIGFSISIRVSRSEGTVGLRWLEGHDSRLFESLSGYVKTQLKSTM